MDFFSKLLAAIFGTGAAVAVARPVQASTPAKPSVAPKPIVADYLQTVATYTTFYPRDIVAVAREIQNRYPRLAVIDPRWSGCQGVVESGDYNRPTLSLTTTKSNRDWDGVSSYGLMQVRTKTATDMYDRAGFRDFGRPDMDLLNISTANIYFSLAVHADNFERYKRAYGRAPTIEWMLRAYNGGYGNGKGSTATNKYLAKCQMVKAAIWNSL